MTQSAQLLRREQRLLRISTLSAAGFAIVGIVWGLAAGSQIIVLDGAYALIGVLLGGLSLRAAQLVERGPTNRYPFGREALAPLVVGVQGLVLIGSLGYAALDAVAVILAGGSEPELGAAMLYALLSTAATIVIWRLLLTGAQASELVRAEAAQWYAGLLLSIGMFVGFLAAWLLTGSPADALVPYFDPAMVVAAAVLISPTPIRMLVSMYRELLEGAPSAELAEPLHRVIEEVSAEIGLPQPVTRMGKLGRKLYIELDYLVVEGRWTISDADRVRRILIQRLAEPGRLLWVNVELHTDPEWDAE